MLTPQGGTDRRLAYAEMSDARLSGGKYSLDDGAGVMGTVDAGAKRTLILAQQDGYGEQRGEAGQTAALRRGHTGGRPPQPAPLGPSSLPIASTVPMRLLAPNEGGIPCTGEGSRE
jgi:hypothetical protein